jgi:hypothetical protein
LDGASAAGKQQRETIVGYNRNGAAFCTVLIKIVEGLLFEREFCNALLFHNKADRFLKRIQKLVNE